MHNVFHVSALKFYRHSGNYQPSPLQEVINDVLEYEVDWVEATRYEGQRRQYLVHWVCYHDLTWEPVGYLTTCAEKLKEFWHFKQMECPHPFFGA
jgi:hypothetical protein